jgi:hypothetical protein
LITPAKTPTQINQPATNFTNLFDFLLLRSEWLREEEEPAARLCVSIRTN